MNSVSYQPVATAPFRIEVDRDRCIGCSLCVKKCPVQTIGMVPRARASQEQQTACQYTCPAGNDIRGYMQLLANGGSYEDAWRIIVETNPMPAVTGRVCPHLCEGSCNRSNVDAPLNIHGMERFIGDYAIEKGLSFPKPAMMKGEKVAVVGSGPSGMSCAYQLARLGYQVTVFESAPKPGGMLTWAIPRYRLPEEVVANEIQRIIDLDVVLKLNVTVGEDVTIPRLRAEGFKAIYIDIGLQGGRRLGLESEDAQGVVSGVEFLRKIKQGVPADVSGKVVVIGGGNVAADVARTAIRTGAATVTMYCLESAGEMPASAEEIEEAVEEGIIVHNGWGPKRILVKDGRVAGVEFKKCVSVFDADGRFAPMYDENETVIVEADRVLVSIGQSALWGRLLEGLSVELTPGGIAKADGLTFSTREKGVFAGGDATKGPGLVTEAIGAGRKAAMAIDAFIRGKDVVLPQLKKIDFTGVPFPEVRKADRSVVSITPAAQRLEQPAMEVCPSMTSDQALFEPGRCLGCGLSEPYFYGVQFLGKICIDCHNCQAVCPQEAIRFPKSDEPGSTCSTDSLRPEKPAPLNRINDRRAVRIYQDQPVPRGIIARVIDACMSSGDCQGWKFVVVTDRRLLADLSDCSLRFHNALTKLKKVLSFLNPGNGHGPVVTARGSTESKPGDGMVNAPAAIFLLKHDRHTCEPELDTGLLLQNMVKAADSLGLGTCSVGFVTDALNLDPVTRKKFSRKLGLERPYSTVSLVMTLGYPAVQKDSPEELTSPEFSWIE
jgi:NADPH-dependent glutamate synthase beta subunit-like oxidoreductase/nitroreductase